MKRLGMLVHATGKKDERQFFFSTPTQFIVWNGEGAKEAFLAHLRSVAKGVRT